MTGVCDGSGSLRGGRGRAGASQLPRSRPRSRGVQELRRQGRGPVPIRWLRRDRTRSRAPKRVPRRTPEALEDEIVALRKELTELGVDAGAQTIAYHLGLRHEHVPSVSTIWRVLRRRGFVVRQPHKRPRSSWIRFEATLPNECWQSEDPVAPEPATRSFTGRRHHHRARRCQRSDASANVHRESLDQLSLGSNPGGPAPS
jgi:hypothetical protein